MAIKKITSTDIALAKAYFTILVETAIKRTTISYGDLVAISKERFPSDGEITSGVPAKAGRRLEVLRKHTDLFDLSDISCLAVSASSQEVGDAYHLKKEVKTTRSAVYETHWLNYFVGVNKALDLTYEVYGLGKKPPKSDATL